MCNKGRSLVWQFHTDPPGQASAGDWRGCNWMALWRNQGSLSVKTVKVATFRYHANCSAFKWWYIFTMLQQFLPNTTRMQLSPMQMYSPLLMNLNLGQTVHFCTTPADDDWKVRRCLFFVPAVLVSSQHQLPTGGITGASLSIPHAIYKKHDDSLWGSLHFLIHTTNNPKISISPSEMQEEDSLE